MVGVVVFVIVSASRRCCVVMREEILAKSRPIAREKVTILLLQLSRLGCKCVGLTTMRGFMYRRENARVLGRMYMANFVKGSDSENTGLALESNGAIENPYNRQTIIR